MYCVELNVYSSVLFYRYVGYCRCWCCPFRLAFVALSLMCLDVYEIMKQEKKTHFRVASSNAQKITKLTENWARARARGGNGKAKQNENDSSSKSRWNENVRSAIREHIVFDSLEDDEEKKTPFLVCHSFFILRNCFFFLLFFASSCVSRNLREFCATSCYVQIFDITGFALASQP